MVGLWSLKLEMAKGTQQKEGAQSQLALSKRQDKTSDQ